MKKLQAIFVSCLAIGLAMGCAPEDQNAAEYDLEDTEMLIPANDGSAPVAAVDPSAPPPPPPPGPAVKKDQVVVENSVPPEKLESLINVSKAAEGDEGLRYTVQEALENYYSENLALPPNFGTLVESGHLAKAPITPKGKKILINGKTLEVTIVDAEEGSEN